MRFFEKFSKERYTPLYPFQKGIKGYKRFLGIMKLELYTMNIHCTDQD